MPVVNSDTVPEQVGGWAALRASGFREGEMAHMKRAGAACVWILLVTSPMAAASGPQDAIVKDSYALSETKRPVLLAQHDDSPGACVQSNNLTGQSQCNEAPSEAFCGKGFPWVTSTKFSPGASCCGDDVCR